MSCRLHSNQTAQQAAQSDVGERSPQSDIWCTTQSDIGEPAPQSDDFSSFYPWSSKRQHIEQLEDRAMSLRQLRSMQLLLQGLCKVQLLKCEDFTTKEMKQVRWFDVDMYILAACVIKPLVTHVEAKRGTNERYSWVEFVATKSQPPDVLVSHAWSGKFRDFMEAIESSAQDNELSSTSTFWVCTFALNRESNTYQSCCHCAFCDSAILAVVRMLRICEDRHSCSHTFAVARVPQYSGTLLSHTSVLHAASLYRIRARLRN